MSQGDDRIDAQGPARRQPAAQCGGRGQYSRSDQQRDRVPGRHVDELGLEDRHHGQRAGESDGEPDPHREHAQLKHQGENVTRGRANRDPDADLLRALVHRMRDDGIQADRRDEQRRRGKDQEQRAIDAIGPVVERQTLRQCFWAFNRSQARSDDEIRIESLDFTPKCRDESPWRRRRFARSASSPRAGFW